MLVMHVGPHKTATTYIQRNLAASALDLKARGWTYPQEGTQGEPAHHHLAHHSATYLPETSAHHDHLRQLAEREPGNLVFSAEGFCRWGPDKFNRLAEVLGRDKIDIVYVIRDPISTFYSYWAEEVKQGYSAGLPERFCMSFNDPIKSRLLNPMIDLNPLLRAGEIKVHVVPYDLLKRREIDIFEHLCTTVLGVDGVNVPEQSPRNAAYPIEFTEFLRLVTLRASDGKAWIGSTLRKKLLEMTTAQERTEITSLVKAEGVMAKRKIVFGGKPQMIQRIDQLLRNNLKGYWTLDPGDEPLFGNGPVNLDYYNDYLLLSKPAIRDLVESVYTRLALQHTTTPVE